MFDWDDVRVFLAVAQGGSLTSAGLRLGMDAATVGRRIARLESSLKATLVVRSRSGVHLTAAGAQLLEATSVAEAAMEAAGTIGNLDQVAGTVRISAAEGFGTAVLAPALGKFRAEKPHLRIELAASPGFLSPSRREVDMAITLSAPEGHRLVVEPLAGYQLALYAAPEYLARRSSPRSVSELRDHDIVGYIDDLIYAPELRYLDEVMLGIRPKLASSSIRAQREIILGGGGIGVLPCFLAEGLVRVVEPTLLQRRFWLSTHRDVHGTSRMKAVRAWIKGICVANSGRMSPFASARPA